MRAEHIAREQSFRPSRAAWRAHERAVNEPGEALDAATATLASARFDFDFSRVRVHRSDSADQAADAMSARAYTWDEHVFFRRNEHAAASGVLLHELGHVVQQAGQTPTVMRAPASAPPPATYIIVYGTGRTSPQTLEHNAERAFKMAAEAKRREIVARLGKASLQNNIVLEYCPTENELKAVLNKKYALPVKEIHIFSHGWNRGINLGGPDPGPGKKAPDKPEERQVTSDELGDYDIQQWADQPSVVLYGCNTGNPTMTYPIAQSVSDAFGVPVTGPTLSSHFEFGGTWGVRQVPDTPGEMMQYTPAYTAIHEHLKQAENIVGQIAAHMKAKGGLLRVMKSTQDAYALRDRLDRHATWLHRVLADPRSTIANRETFRAKITTLVERADALLAAH